ncbi:MAG: hypothetical protein CMI16_03005 [Opitutaceae bacterium]|nr:hypothetical protein [Opitutaceae bacterium]|tara:strand:+ start:1261 stop:1839 length:579 start_codon:yes stop_codon:yes gene_type:complete
MQWHKERSGVLLHDVHAFKDAVSGDMTTVEEPNGPARAWEAQNEQMEEILEEVVTEGLGALKREHEKNVQLEAELAVREQKMQDLDAARAHNEQRVQQLDAQRARDQQQFMRDKKQVDKDLQNALKKLKAQTRDDETDLMCVLCFSEERRWACMPCGHFTFCDNCKKTYENRGLTRCPIGKEMIQSYHQIYT